MRALPSLLLLVLLAAPLVEAQGQEIARLLAAGAHDRAAAALARKLAALEPSQRSAFLRAVRDSCARQGELPAYAGLLEGHDTDPVVLFQLGTVQRDLKLLRRAEQTFERLLRLDPHSPDVLLLQASVAYRRFDHARAADLAREAGSRGAAWARGQQDLVDDLASSRIREGTALLLGLALWAVLGWGILRMSRRD